MNTSGGASEARDDLLDIAGLVLVAWEIWEILRAVLALAKRYPAGRMLPFLAGAL